MKIKLIRTVSHQDGTFGTMIIHGAPFCLTLEEEQGGNKKDTAIPAGIYKVTPHSGPRFKNVFVLHDVPGRSAILIHAGNTEDDTSGCILLGKEYGILNNKHAILRSGEALAAFKVAVPPEFTLEIVDCFG